MHNFNQITECTDKISFSYESLQERYDKLNNIIEQSISLNLNDLISKEKASKTYFVQDLEAKYIKKITKKLNERNYSFNQRLEDFIYETSERNRNLLEITELILQYPMDKITAQIKRYAKGQEIESSTITTVLQNIRSSMLRTILQLITEKEEVLLEHLFEKEINHLKLDYYLKNESLRILTPHKYKSFLQMMHKGVYAFYSDFKSYQIQQNPYQETINTYFENILAKMETCASKYFVEFDKIAGHYAPEIGVFPSSIFKDFEAFNHFKKCETKATSADDIGFLFRYFSEKVSPKEIIATETQFRKWYNEQEPKLIELKAPIKTYHSIGAKSKKILMITTDPLKHTEPFSSAKTTNSLTKNNQN